MTKEKGALGFQQGGDLRDAPAKPGCASGIASGILAAWVFDQLQGTCAHAHVPARCPGPFWRVPRSCLLRPVKAPCSQFPCSLRRRRLLWCMPRRQGLTQNLFRAKSQHLGLEAHSNHHPAEIRSIHVGVVHCKVEPLPRAALANS